MNFVLRLALQEKKIWWRLASRCCWNRARCLTCFLSASVTRKDFEIGTWTDPSFQRHYRFRLRTLGMCRAKDLSPLPSSRVLLEKLTSYQLDNTFLAFRGTRLLITSLTCPHHVSLSRARSIHSMPHPTYWRSTLILLYILLMTFQVVSRTHVSHQNIVWNSPNPPAFYMTAHHILIRVITWMCVEEYGLVSYPLSSFLHSPITSFLPGPNILLSTLFSNTSSLRSSVNVSDQVSHTYKKRTNNSSVYLNIYISG